MRRSSSSSNLRSLREDNISASSASDSEQEDNKAFDELLSKFNNIVLNFEPIDRSQMKLNYSPSGRLSAPMPRIVRPQARSGNLFNVPKGPKISYTPPTHNLLDEEDDFSLGISLFEANRASSSTSDSVIRAGAQSCPPAKSLQYSSVENDNNVLGSLKRKRNCIDSDERSENDSSKRYKK